MRRGTRGIRHYDVAPSYGFGEAEGCLGEFLSQHAGEATVTTKFGIPPAEASSFWGVARGLARPVIKLFPGMKVKLKGAASVAGGPKAARPVFDAGSAKASLDRSLAALKVDRLDVFLLHEAEAGDLTHQDLHLFLRCRWRPERSGRLVWEARRPRFRRSSTFGLSIARCCNTTGRCLDPLISPTQIVSHTSSIAYGELHGAAGGAWRRFGSDEAVVGTLRCGSGECRGFGGSDVEGFAGL